MKRFWILNILLSCFFLVNAQSAPGPFAAGYRNLAFTNGDLLDSTVSVRVYYPATTTGLNAPVASGVFPAVGCGHGFNLSFTNYGVICSHLASHGFIVISPDVQNGFSVSHAEFARELAACIIWMQEEGQDTASDFFGVVDTMSGVFGHSMGGGASAMVHTVMPGIDAISGLSPAETTPSAIAALASWNGYYQVISGNQDNVTPEADHQIPMYNAATGLKHWVSITGGAHCKYTDGTTICDLVSGAGSISREEQIFLAKRYITAFFRFALQHETVAETFLCGDSAHADTLAGKLSIETTFSCGPLSTAEPQKNLPFFWPNPARDCVFVRSNTEPALYFSDGRKCGIQWLQQGDVWKGDLHSLSAQQLWLVNPDSGQKAGLFTIK